MLVAIREPLFPLQAGFRRYDTDMQGSLDANQLYPAVHDFLTAEEAIWEAAAKVMIDASERHEAIIARQEAAQKKDKEDERLYRRRKKVPPPQCLPNPDSLSSR